MEEMKCYYCGNIKKKNEFYKNNLSKCKNCKRDESRNNKIGKNDVFNMLIEI